MSDLSDTHPIVDTINGRVKGKNFKTYYGQEAYAFHRIPYMKPPIGKLRFKDPEPFGDWTGVIDGTNDVHAFAQFAPMTGKFEGNESELYINVFTKHLNPSKLQPIVVYIHGGGFTCGSSASDFTGPDNFLQKDIVFCSLNYRLAVLGFMNFDDPSLNVPGNAGLKDQTLALKWIKQNAARFGGDPNNITLLGLSAGAASVCYHMISNLSRDLFHKAILMSGAVLNSWASVPDRKFGLRLAKHFGWQDGETQAKALEILQNTPVDELVMAQGAIVTDDERLERIYEPFVPSIEPYISEQSFLAEPIMDALSKQWSRNIPIIIGAATDEANLLSAYWEKLGNLPKNTNYIGDLTYLVPLELGLDRNSEKCKTMAEQMKSFYFGGEIPTISDGDTFDKYLKLMSDKLFVYGIYATIKSRVSDPKNTTPTYFYRFNYYSDNFNFTSIFPLPRMKGVGHGDDLNYVFKTFMYDRLVENSADHEKVKQISGMWNNFVISGDPNCTEIEPTIWTPVIKPNEPFKCMNITDELNMIDYPETDRMQFWDKIFQNVND